jgi:hypothetical protein
MLEGTNSITLVDTDLSSSKADKWGDDLPEHLG